MTTTTTHPDDVDTERPTVHVSARRWFQRTYGNTYHTVRVWIDGEHVGTSPVTYGYGDHYMHTAGQLVIDAGHPLADMFEPHPGSRDAATGHAYDLASMRRDDDDRATVTVDVVDVTRRRDLHSA